ncbi:MULTISPECIES: TonB-dependent receptor [unclassified Sphingomonas]|uniref:TonB-dependent receptor n=1 Tax=unclassified Sphingomonas TaxID=196159 RepID=UPI000A8CBDC7|nr:MULTISPECIES: TonB-dependent receptor [unclassified Sphingomonas]
MLNSKTIKTTLLAGACAISSQAAMGAAPVQAADRVGSAADGSPKAIQFALADQASPDSAVAGRRVAAAEEVSGAPDEIVVTAQKRAERLQDVPISIAVLSGNALDKSSINSAAEALRTVAGVSVMEAYQGSGSLVTIRGVAAGGPLFGGASPVSYYVDSVPFGLIKSAIAPNAQAFDLQQVEVLRGPQGTLYGSNAQNGVVRILTHDAELDGFDFKARVSGSATKGGGDNYQGDMAVNVPIIDGVLAARAVLGYENNSGWIDTPGPRNANDSEVKNARLKINAQPNDNLSVGLSAWISRADYGMPSFGNSDDFNTVAAPQPVTTDFDAYGLKIGYDFPTFTVTSGTSYLRYRNTGYLNLAPLGIFIAPGVPINLFTSQGARITTEELNLASTNSSAWRWTAGAMYRHDSEDLLQANLPTTAATSTKMLSKSYAVYGELTRLLFDKKVELTAGVRHFVDKQSNVAVSSGGVRDSDTFKATTPRFVVTVHPNRQSTIYASYSQGFRSGVVQGPPLPDALKFTNPDKLRNYEMGAKGTLMDGMISYDAAVYYIDWKDVQQLITVPVVTGGVSIPRAAIVNSESASGPGADLSLSIRPVADLTLTAQFSWNNLTFDENVISGGQVLFAKGARLNFSPKYTGGASAEYAFPLGGDLRGKLSLSGNYTSTQAYRGLVGGAAVSEDGDKMFVARADFSVLFSERFGVTAFIDNLTNERGTPVRTPYLPATDDWDFRTRPRTVGVRLTYGM